MKRTISEIMNEEWKLRAIYTIEERAIPSIIDGFKPVNRFLYYQGQKQARNSFDKVASIGGSVASAGYHHGESSAFNALIDMTKSYSNNLSVFIGDGNFGSKIDHNAAAPRYIFAKINTDISDKLFLDDKFTVKHEDEEIKTPKYYLPLIPLILINGTKGIATGYACDIPPHCPLSIIDSLISLASGKPEINIVPKYYGNSCSVRREDNSYILEGTYEILSNNKLKITELPPSHDRLSYESVLDKLEDAGKIISYENFSSGDRFEFVVKMKRGVEALSHEHIIKLFKLSMVHTWNVTSISESGKLQIWNPDSAFEDILNYFYSFRLDIIKKRLEAQISELEKNKIPNLIAFLKFCEDVIYRRIDIRNFKSDEEFSELLKKSYFMSSNKMIERTMNTPIRHFTDTALQKNKSLLETFNSELSLMKSWTPEQVYIQNLNSLRTAYLATLK